MKFPFGNAQGSQNRNPSIQKTIYQFSDLASNNKKHAQWNVRANWILTAAIRKAGGFAGYKGQEALRAAEAALFMVGYDFPDMEKSTVASKKKIKTNKKTSVRLNKKGKVTLSTAVKKIVDTLVDNDGVVEFTPKQVLAKASSGGSVITAEQVRPVLLRDCVNSGHYYSGGKGYYQKVKKGVFTRREL